MQIILFGTGCEMCREIAHNIEAAIASLNYDINFEKTADLHRMLSYGIKSTPSVVINEKVVSISTYLSSDDVLALIHANCSSEHQN
ncbi:MAG: thioredoxin family protein [Sulfuricurvum sp.]|uniref:thioredoxin family protein n=1 Tax=Sulfuricurvum sp. TaxID=2025608 RepID=UPI00263A1392|nr:thioredoxin family protein [Sulfuricurvum sp.]MDD2369697.1 thioredoxin family protein [Sulfuricurvum sp.]MDD2950712.1 thioredoxin family protein [Sulfuricurvum sp.]MDD5118027.1 thioredoxin family protein [Sulfuricurvum sp.]